MKRIAGAFSHALISSNHLRTFDVHPRDRPLFTIASANCFTTPWLMLRVCLRVCSGKRKRFLFFFLSFSFLFFSSLFPLKPGHVNNASEFFPPSSRLAVQSGFRNIFKRSFLLLSRTDANRGIVSLRTLET